MIISFVTSGLRTTTQDLGRRGYTHLGIPVGGLLYAPTMRYANQLVGNPLNTPVLEITLSGPQLVCEQAGSIAMTGANFGVHINGEEKPSNARIVINAGDTISFSRPQTGCRGYLAVEGDWQVKRWLGSASALRVGSQELLPNAVWKAGDSLVTRARRVQPWSLPMLKPGPLSTQISVCKGPEFNWLTEEAREALLSTPIKIREPSNRVGLRTDTTLALQKHKKHGDALIRRSARLGAALFECRGHYSACRRTNHWRLSTRTSVLPIIAQIAWSTESGKHVLVNTNKLTWHRRQSLTETISSVCFFAPSLWIFSSPCTFIRLFAR